jgi:hypothetical protein
MSITQDLPVRTETPAVPAAASTEGGTAWCPVFEKALAGVDQTWHADRRSAWERDWTSISPQINPDNQGNTDSGGTPVGYVRLNQGSHPWDRAELLTQLTGREAVVREFPSGEDEWLVNRIIRAQLAVEKPVLVGTRPLNVDERKLPHDLVPNHVYEVTDVVRGKIILRNPWNKDHPEPMETGEFTQNVRPHYTTLA